MLFAMASDIFGGPKETPPQGPPPKPFKLPAPEDFTLPNGMQVTIVPYGIVPKLAVRAFVEAGGIDESARQVWLSKLTASLMKEGTTTRSGEQVAREAAEMGGQLEVEAGSDFTSAGGVVLSDFGPQFIALLADVLAHPALPAAELSRLKADLVRDLAIDRTEPQTLARERFLENSISRSSLRPNFSGRRRFARLCHWRCAGLLPEQLRGGSHAPLRGR